MPSWMLTIPVRLEINNMGKKYGLTPIFRALPATIMLKGFQGADSASAKSKAKKIIHQKLRKETMGQDYTNLGLEEMAYAHQELMKAFRSPRLCIPRRRRWRAFLC